MGDGNGAGPANHIYGVVVVVDFPICPADHAALRGAIDLYDAAARAAATNVVVDLN